MENVGKTFTVRVSGNGSAVPIAREILTCVREFKGSVYIEKGGRTVSANSMIGILSLGLQNGDTIKVFCSGIDEFAANLCLEKISKVLAE